MRCSHTTRLDDLAPRVPPAAAQRVKLQLALAQIEAVIAENPQVRENYVVLASLHYKLDDFGKALAAINMATDHGPLEPLELEVKACILAEYAANNGKEPRSMLEEALSIFTELRRSDGDKANADYNIGNVLSYLGDHQKAIAYYDQALAESPRPDLASQIWKNRGTCLFHLGDHEEEFRSYQKALELEPNRWEAYSSWGVTDMRLGNYAHAKDMFLRAMQANPALSTRDASHPYWLGYTLWKSGDMPEAYRYAARALAVSPQHAQAWLLSARLLRALWRSDAAYVPEATRFFRARIVDKPDDMFARRELYLVLNSSNSREAALALVSSAAPTSDAPAQSLYAYASMLDNEGRKDDAIHYLELAFAKSRDHNIVHRLALLKRGKGLHQEAIDLLSLIADDEPEQVLSELADCYHFLGNDLEALRCSAKLAIRQPDTEKWWNNMGQAAIQLGRFRIAVLHDIFFLKACPSGLDASTWGEKKVSTLVNVLRAEFGEQFLG